MFNCQEIFERLNRKTDFYLLWGLVFTLSVWLLYVLLFSQTFLNWWIYPSVIYGLILSIVLSATTISVVIKYIDNIKRRDRNYLYISILLDYDIARLKFTTSILRTELN
jgi:tetrahydromethanopterin S-methyltransferase subunit G